MIKKRPVIGWIGDGCSGGLTIYPDPGDGIPANGIDLGRGIPTELVDGFRAELEDVLDRIVAAQVRYGAVPSAERPEQDTDPVEHAARRTGEGQ